MNIELNKVDGNLMLIQELEQDLFYCKEGDHHVPEDEFNHKRCVCYSCFWKI